MRAAIFRNGDIVVDRLADPTPQPGQVLVKTLACGICGSDLHARLHAPRLVDMARRAGARTPMDLARDVVFGHEFCAEVVAHGPGTARTLAPGTRVCSVPLTVVGDQPHSVGYSNDMPGGFGELMVLSERLLLPVPNGLPSEQAALTEPMAVGWHAVAKARLMPDDVPLVIGCGPVGLAVIAALKLKKVAPIIAADFSPLRRTLAAAMGADVVVDPAAHSPYRRWAELAEPQGYDRQSLAALFRLGPQPKPGVIFECVGVPGVLQQVLEGAPRDARVVVVGVCMEPDRIEPFFAIRKELSLHFVLGYSGEEFAQTLRHLAEGALDGGPMITGRVGLDSTRNAFTDLADPVRHAKILVEPWR
jgi:threonine dehydrogenase-like Zn-dependent dehydrogenase